MLTESISTFLMEAQHSIQPTDNFQNLPEGELDAQLNEILYPVY